MDARLALDGVDDIDDIDDVVPRRIVPRVLVRIALAACNLALAKEAPIEARTRRSKVDGIARILHALARPDDPASKAVATSLRPTRNEEAAFLRLVKITFRTAGKPGGESNAIRTFMSRNRGG